MKTSLQTKFYPGQVARPTVETKVFDNEKILTICTPWGTPQALDLLNQTISEKFLDLKDAEITITGAVTKSEDKNAHFLKALVQKTNSEIIRQFNKDFYTSACEALIVHYNDYNISWVQVGQPALILLRGKSVQILQSSRDLSEDYSMSAPLPAQLLGATQDLNYNYQNFLSRPGDVLIFHTGKQLPALLNSLKSATADENSLLEELTRVLVNEEPKSAFWLGCLFIG